MTFVHSRQWLKFTSVGVESDSIPPAAGVHTAGGGWPIFEARALANMAARKGEQAGASSPKSDELTPDIFTGEVQPVAPVKAPAHRWWIGIQPAHHPLRNFRSENRPQAAQPVRQELHTPSRLNRTVGRSG